VLLCVGGWISLFADATHFGMSSPRMGPADAVMLSCSMGHGFRDFPIHWGAMIFAMMIPPLTGHLRAVAARSFWSRRHRAIAAFLAGYVALWLIFGVVVHISRVTLISIWPQIARWDFLLLLVFAALWQLTPAKRLALAACHRTVPLAPHGIRADMDCCRYGFGIAWACCLSCWVLMIACDAAENMLGTMLLVTCVVWSERLWSRQSAFKSSLALGAFAMVVSILPLLRQ